MLGNPHKKIVDSKSEEIFNILSQATCSGNDSKLNNIKLGNDTISLKHARDLISVYVSDIKIDEPVCNIISKCEFDRSIVEGTVSGSTYTKDITKSNLNDLLQAKDLNNLLFVEDSYNEKKNGVEEFHKVLII